MDTLITLLLLGQGLGALVGVATAIVGEVAYARAYKDGNIDHAERAHLAVIGRGLKFGMTLLLLSSFGLVIATYARAVSPQPAVTASYWMLIALVLVIIGVSWALSRGKLSFLFGSAVAFTAWWFLAYLTFGQLPTSSFGATTALFVVAVLLFAAILHGCRLFARAGQ